VITGRSKLHVEVILHRLKRKFHVEVITHPPRLALKEAILTAAEGHHKHKKQSGGHGQYGEVYLRLKPTPRGEGFKFTDNISQGRIPQQYVPAIEKGIRKTIEKGVIAGYPSWTWRSRSTTGRTTTWIRGPRPSSWRGRRRSRTPSRSPSR